MVEEVMDLLKARLGISTSKRDDILYLIISGIVSECKNKHGVILNKEDADHILFVLDWATWKYKHPEGGTIPRSIDLRLKNMIIQKECAADG